MKPSARNSALLVAGTYTTVSLAWITFSDRIASILAVDYARLAWLQTIKGIFFVLATGTLLFFFSKRQIESLIASQTRREQVIVVSLREKKRCFARSTTGSRTICRSSSAFSIFTMKAGNG